MDYFTKWVEAEPLANIRDVDVKKFIWKNIVRGAALFFFFAPILIYYYIFFWVYSSVGRALRF